MCIGWLRVRAARGFAAAFSAARCVVCVSSAAVSLRMVCGGWVMLVMLAGFEPLRWTTCSFAQCLVSSS